MFNNEFTGINLRQIKDIVDDVQQIAGGLTDGIQIVGLALINPGAHQQVTETDNAIKRGADFMADVGQKLGFHAAGFQCFFTADGQLPVTDLHFIQGFLQILCCLLQIVLVFCIDALQRAGHRIDTGSQLLEFATAVDVNTAFELAVF